MPADTEALTSSPEEQKRRTLQQLDERLDRIALLPGVVSSLAALNPEDAAFPERVADLARKDPPFALRLMRLANAAGNAGYDAADTIPQALMRAGARTLAEQVLAMSVVEVFVPRTRGQRELWTHSLQVAVAARTIAQHDPELGVHPEQAYLAGLLHDIGRFVLFEHTPDELGRIEEAHAANPKELVAAEIGVCGFDHAELGWHVCRKWVLPERVAELVRLHHVYHDQPAKMPPEVLTLARIVQQADWLSFALLREASSGEPSLERRFVLERALAKVPADAQVTSAVLLSQHADAIDAEAQRAAEAIGIASASPL